MELNHDCVRDILIWVENNVQISHPRYTDNLIDDLQDRWSKMEIVYCVAQLNEAGLLDGGAIIDGGAVSINSITKLTWNGHEYLDNIRDDKVWKETKKTIFSKIGSASLSIVGSVASKIIESRLGL